MKHLRAQSRLSLHALLEAFAPAILDHAFKGELRNGATHEPKTDFWFCVAGLTLR